ncbi:hypothetical protein BY458DRAFT_527473 [Sporodiniella umbellata]|nr:hypothetical protein BY458DRAFT_527473 [Sporodiniella umbellata]
MPAQKKRLIYHYTSLFGKSEQLDIEHIFKPLNKKLQVQKQWELNCWTVIACGILSIWQIHWNRVFHDTPFWLDEAAAKVTLLLRKIHSENKTNLS